MFPRQWFVQGALSLSVAEGVDAALGEGSEPDFIVEVFAPALHLGAQLPGALDHVAYPPVTAGEEGLHQRLLGVVPRKLDAGAVQFTESTFTDPYRFLLELTDRARKHGAAIRTNTELTDVAIDDGRFRAARLHTGERLEGDAIVLAAGIWSTAIARRIGLSIPMQAGKGYHRDVTRPTPTPRGKIPAKPEVTTRSPWLTSENRGTKRISRPRPSVPKTMPCARLCWSIPATPELGSVNSNTLE